MNWLSGLFGRRKQEKELEEEVRTHLEMAAKDRVERGEPAKEAERAARRCKTSVLASACWRNRPALPPWRF